MPATPFLLLTALVAQASGPRPEAAVSCLSTAWNAHSPKAARGCYAPGVVAVRHEQRSPIDWVAEEGYRGFDAVAGSVFRFEVLTVHQDTVDTEMTERNAFLEALGLPQVVARWRYVVRDGLITEEHHLRADSAFAAVFREFTAWARKERPGRWTKVTDLEGYAHFDGGTANDLILLAGEWRESR